MSVIDPAALDVLRELQDADDPNMLKDLIVMFLDSTPERMKKIKAAIESQESKSLLLEAHTLKSSCANLGANPMREVCLQLESLGNAQTFEGATELFENLERQFHLAKSELQACLK